MAKIISNNEVNVNGSRVFIENGTVKTVFSDEIQKTGYMSVEEARAITLAGVKLIYEMNDDTQSE